MSRKTLDLVFAGGGALLALLLLVVGFVLADQASFAKTYVQDQLGQQKIVFTQADKLTAEETSWKPGSVCLTQYAGQPMETGKQAECYANFYIAMHMDRSATAAGFQGETYATLGGIRTQLSADIAAAKEKGDTQGAADLQKKLDSATSLRTTMQTGETLRGMLLTSFGFSIFGEKAGQVSTVAYLTAALLALLAVAGFVHAIMTPREKTVFAPAPASVRAPGQSPDPRTA